MDWKKSYSREWGTGNREQGTGKAGGAREVNYSHYPLPIPLNQGLEHSNFPCLD